MTEHAKPTLVKDIMVREVATISPFATLHEAMDLMKQRGIKSLVVEKKHPHDAYGIITYTTILRTIVAEEGDIDLINVYDVCAKPVITVSSELEVRHAAKLMVDYGITRVVVTRDNELIGIITMHDIVDSILALLDR